MIEIVLEEFEDFYKGRLDSQFAKIKKVVQKLISEIRDGLIEIKVCMDHFIEAGKGKIEEKALKSLHFFSDRIRKEIDEIEIPEEELNYDNIMNLVNSIKRLFTSINEIARKSLPKFQKEVQPEIKELNYITRKIQKKQAVLEQFLRKKYEALRTAEYLLKKLPKLFSLRENIEHAKADLEEYEKQLEEHKTHQQKLNNRLIELEKNILFSDLEDKKEKRFTIRMKINDQLGFKKALKKLKHELEKETIHISNLNMIFLKNFLKDPIKTLRNERQDLPNFSNLLVQLRHVLEENKLDLKTDTKEKTIEQINLIFKEKKIFNFIEELNELKQDTVLLEEKVKDVGLFEELEDVKNQISTNSVRLEHIQNDLDRKNKDYMRYLAALKNEREDLQNAVEGVLNEDIKINITFSF
ncbi:MAG: hypothetical protein ACFFDX_08110 [Candidatus Odinarchaeota archaeon]